MGEVLAERKFIVEASGQRVWKLLGRVIFDSLEMERFHAVDDRNFDARLKVKLAFLTLPMQVKGVMTDITPLKSLTVRLEVEGLGVIHLEQEVTIAMSPAEGGKTEVVCRASLEKMGALLKPFLLGRMRSFSGKILESLEERLRQLA